MFIQHPRYNIEVFLKRMKVGRAIIRSHWSKVARIFNITEASILAFYFPKVLDVVCELGAVVLSVIRAV